MTAKRSSPPLPLAELHRSLLRWYRREKRAFAWRDSEDPYLVLVSEFMLQQTQASRAERFLPAWINRFPDIVSLAHAGRRDVLLAWGGLGYNRRALYLHRTAGEIVSEHGGTIPKDPAVLKSLPGIGAYTAHAVACFAHGVRVPVVDVNVRRVLSRLSKRRKDAADLLDDACAWECARAMLPRRSWYDWNQALMELGALVCSAANPSCTHCPLECHCPSAHRLQTGMRPRTSAAEAVPRRIVRGRVIAYLRSAAPRHSVPLARLEEFLAASFPGKGRPGMLEVLRSLSRDGMIFVRAGGKAVDLARSRRTDAAWHVSLVS